MLEAKELPPAFLDGPAGPQAMFCRLIHSKPSVGYSLESFRATRQV
jgi:hypothetical protein